MQLRKLWFYLPVSLVFTSLSSAQTFKEGEILVKIKRDIELTELTMANAAFGADVLERLRNPRIFRIALPPGLSEQQTIQLFQELPFVELATVNHIIRDALSSTFPNDGKFTEQWHLDNAADIDIDAPEV